MLRLVAAMTIPKGVCVLIPFLKKLFSTGVSV